MSAQTLSGIGQGDEREKGDGRSDEDRTGKQGSREKTNVGSKQGQCSAETYVSGPEDRRE